MSSNQWNLVTKSKKQKNLEKKVEAKQEQKRLDELMPKLDEILPSNEYRNLIAGNKPKSNNQLNSKSSGDSSTKTKSPAKKAKLAHKSEASDAKKQQQQQQQKPKTTKTKNIECALRSISAEDFTAQLEQLKLQFPGSELLWLKGIAAYFNLAMPFDSSPNFSNKSVHYPSNLARPQLKIALQHFLKTVGTTNLSYFYHTLLVSMVMELNKDLPVVGYKFLLQVIGQCWPNICTDNMASTALLRNSYQNRPNIGQSIFWAIGQGGYQDLQTGIKVWQNLMLPNLEMRHYSKFVTDYIEFVLLAAQNQSLSFNQNEFFSIYNALKADYSGLSRVHQESLKRSSMYFLLKYIDSSSKHANIFLTLFRDIESAKKHYVELEGCLSCILKSNSDESLKIWRMNYKKNLMPTILLLQKIVEEWDERSHVLAHSTSFQKFLRDARLLNEELLLAKRRDPNLDQLISILQTVEMKSSAQKKKQSTEEKKSCGCCKWVLGSIFVIALIAGVLTYDTNVNGKGVFAKSATGKALKNAGLLPYVEKAWFTTMGASARGYKWAEQHVPPYAKPVMKLSCDLYKLARNTACNAFGALRDFINAKLPVAGKFVEQYVPGLPQKIEDTSVVIKNVAVDTYSKTLLFFKSRVLVGCLSPENLSKAFNQTQNVALEYYNLFHKKVDAYAKLK